MMLVNNEVGTVLPVREAAALVKRYDRRILFHTDAVQGFLKLPFTPAQLGVDPVSYTHLHFPVSPDAERRSFLLQHRYSCLLYTSRCV